MRAKALSYDEVSEAFEVIDGQLWRKGYVDFNGRVRRNKLVKNVSNHIDGYCTVKLKNRTVRYHQIIWVLFNGSITPNCMIDHIDGNRLNNSIDNLRLVLNRQNSQNRCTHRQGKLPGCNFHKPTRKWRAEIWINGKNKHIGLYKTEQEAHAAYLKAVQQLEG